MTKLFLTAVFLLFIVGCSDKEPKKTIPVKTQQENAQQEFDRL